MQSLSSRKYDLNAALSEWIHPSYFVETFIQSLSNLSIITPLPHNLVRSDLQPVPVEVVVKPGPPTKRRRIGRRSPWKHLHGKEPCPGSTEQSNSTVATPVSRPRVPASSSTTRDQVAVDIGEYIEELIDHQFKKMPLETSLCITGTAREIAHSSCDTAIANVHPLLWVEFKNHMFATDLVSHI